MDVEIAAVFIEQPDLDRHGSPVEVLVDLLADFSKEGLHSSSDGGLELHGGHEQDIGETVALVNDAGRAGQLAHDEVIVAVVVVQRPELHRQLAEDVPGTDADGIHEGLSPGVQAEVLLIDQGLEAGFFAHTLGHLCFRVTDLAGLLVNELSKLGFLLGTFTLQLH